MSHPDQPFFDADFDDDADEEPKVDLTKKYFPRFSPLKSLVDRVYGKEFLSTTMAAALEKLEARDALVQASFEQIKQRLDEINGAIAGGRQLGELVATRKDLFDGVCAALAVIGVFIHQDAGFKFEISGVRFEEDARRFILGLGTNSGGERVFLSVDKQTGQFESLLSFPGQDTANCRTLQSGFRKLFPGQVKRRTHGGSVVEDLNETKVGDLFLEF